MADPENSKPPRPKKGINAKIVKHAHRKRFYDYLRGKGRDKFTLSHVYWHMYLRSGKGDVFKLADELAAADLGMDVSVLRGAHRTLVKEGWLVKHRPANQGVPEWTVNTEAIPTAGKPGGGKATSGRDSGGEASTGSDHTAVVLHSLDADASTSSSTPLASTSTGFDLLTDSLTIARENQDQNLSDLGSVETENQPQEGFSPKDIDEFAGTDGMRLYRILHPNSPTRTELLMCRSLLEVQGIPLDILGDILEWNSVHETGKFRIRNATQLTKAFNTGAMLDNYDAHPFDTCPKCKANGMRHWRIRQEQEEENRLRAENARADMIADREARERRELAYHMSRNGQSFCTQCKTEICYNNATVCTACRAGQGFCTVCKKVRPVPGHTVCAACDQGSMEAVMAQNRARAAAISGEIMSVINSFDEEEA
jgi:hypothetical protein